MNVMTLAVAGFLVTNSVALAADNNSAPTS